METLPIAHGGAAELLAKFGESWHPVAMGSAASTPSWVFITGVASALTLGNVSFFISTLFFLGPIVAFIAMYRVLKRGKFSLRISSLGGVIYAMSPVIWNSVNQGRLGTLVISLLIPSFLSLKPLERDSYSNWRKVYGITLLAGFIGAFSPILLILWSLILLTKLAFLLIRRREELLGNRKLSQLIFLNFDLEKRLFALGSIPLLLNFPWSASLIFHPTQILLEPGLPLSGGDALNLLIFNPGGESGIPVWIISPMLLFLLVVLFSNKFDQVGIFATSLLILSLLLSPLHINGHGSTGRFWSGALLVVVESLILPSALKVLVEVLPNLRDSKLGLGHFVSIFIALVTSFSLIGTTTWAITSGANSLLKSGSPNVIPAFITSLSDTPAKPKTLVISKSKYGTTYFITRGSDLELGDPDVAVGTPIEIDQAVDQLISGTGINSSKIIGAYGIQYVYMRNPIDPAIVRTIDGIGGFTRSSATSAGIVWKVFASLPRLSITDASGLSTQLKATEIGGSDDLVFPGRVTLAEKFDGNWKLMVAGKNISLKKSPIGEPYFEVDTLGSLTLEHDGTKRRALISLQALFLLTVIVLSLPAGRRRREMIEL